MARRRTVAEKAALGDDEPRAGKKLIGVEAQQRCLQYPANLRFWQALVLAENVDLGSAQPRHHSHIDESCSKQLGNNRKLVPDPTLEVTSTELESILRFDRIVAASCYRRRFKLSKCYLCIKFEPNNRAIEPTYEQSSQPTNCFVYKMHVLTPQSA